MVVTAGSRPLRQWLEHAEHVHSVGIDLGLDRVGRVAERLGFEAPAHRPAPRTVIVAGTNGKGSTCVAVEALLRSAGLRVGTTLSPHVHVFNERVRIDGALADDDTLCAAFARVEDARGAIPLTYFEFAALVAMECFRGAGVDVAVLEVGLGGRLDAFNLVDADVAVITSIGLDHQAFLGNDVETIGREKAGVMRAGQRVVLGRRVSRSVVEAARQLGCHSTRLGEDFHVRQAPDHWEFAGAGRRVQGLEVGALAPDNCALAMEVAAHVIAAAKLPEQSDQAVCTALAGASLAGRMEAWQIGGDDGRLLILDVAHNPDGARFLAEQLACRHPGRRYVAVLGTLADKDSAGVVAALAEPVHTWVCVPTRGARGLAAEDLAQRARQAGVQCPVVAVSDVAHGLARAFSLCLAGDGMLAFGSFDLVEQMREILTTGHLDAAPAADIAVCG